MNKNAIETPFTISVIVRTKNEENWIKACLSAVYSQEGVSLEVVIVDNNSDDKTVDIARKMGVEKVVSIQSYRPGAALNKGVSVASGDFVVFLSAHCVPYDSSWLSELIRPLLRGEAVASYGRQIPTPATNADNARDLLMVFGSESFVQSKDSKFHNANSCIRRSYVQRFPFDNDISNVEDWYWGSECIERGDSIAYCGAAVVYHHHGINQHSNESSVRAIPVSDLLQSLHLPNAKTPAFMNVDGWKGLLIFSSKDSGKSSLTLINQSLLGESNLDLFITTNVESSENSRSIFIDPKVPFDEYLSIALQSAEERNGQIYDYVCFLDDHYADLDIELVKTNSQNLFSYWVDVASAAREIKGLVYTHGSKEARLISRESDPSPLYETLLGQGSAMRASVVRKKCTNQSEIYISKIVDRRFTIKRA